MHDIVIGAIALFGIAIVAISGTRFMARDDNRLERVALGVTPAAYSERIVDEVMSR